MVGGFLLGGLLGSLLFGGLGGMSGGNLVTTEIRAGAVDYVVDEATGQVIEGSATKPTRFVEYWTFVRPVGANPWRVGAIQQPSA